MASPPGGWRMNLTNTELAAIFLKQQLVRINSTLALYAPHPGKEYRAAVCHKPPVWK
jgi:hypothetical protein